jgi:hypothetical protein
VVGVLFYLRISFNIRNLSSGWVRTSRRSTSQKDHPPNFSCVPDCGSYYDPYSCPLTHPPSSTSYFSFLSFLLSPLTPLISLIPLIHLIPLLPLILVPVPTPFIHPTHIRRRYFHLPFSLTDFLQLFHLSLHNRISPFGLLNWLLHCLLLFSLFLLF